MIVSDANDCTVAVDCEGCAHAATHVGVRLQGFSCRVAEMGSFSLSLSHSIPSLYTCNLSLSLQLYNHTIGIDKILIRQEKEALRGLQVQRYLQSLTMGRGSQNGGRDIQRDVSATDHL